MMLSPQVVSGLQANRIDVERFLSDYAVGYRSLDPCIVACHMAVEHDVGVVPVGPNKRPLVLWKGGGQTNILNILGWDKYITRDSGKSNWAMVTGKGLAVIDKDGPEGEAHLAQLCALYGSLPKTVCAKSGRSAGGGHLYFRLPKEAEQLRTISKFMSGPVDIRGHQGIVVLPGSLHRSGARYEWVAGCSPDEIEFATLPDAWYEALPKRVEHHAISPKARRSGGVPRQRVENSKSCLLGDGENRGGFNGPIYTLAVRFIRTVGPSFETKALAEILRDAILKAPVSPHRDSAEIERYASDEYLMREIESARAWCQREKDNQYGQ